MNKQIKRIFTFMMALIMAAAVLTNVSAADKTVVEKARNDVAAIMLDTVKNPTVDSVGGEWAVLGLARSGYSVPQSYYEGYYKTVEKYVKDCEGVLHEKNTPNTPS